MPVLGPLVAYLPTPRNTSGRLNEPALAQLAENALNAGAHTLAILGSSGGAAYMPRSMRKRVITTVKNVTGDDTQLVAGIGALTTAEILLNLNEAAQAGATGALLQPMSYQPLLNHEVLELYTHVAQQSPLPLIVYNNPNTTRHRFSTEELAHIAQLPNIAGFKDYAANAAEISRRIATITDQLPEQRAKQLDWGYSGDNKGAHILLEGATTWHSALAGVMPRLCVELAYAAVVGRTDEEAAAYAHDLQRALTPLTVMMGQYGSIRVAHAVARIHGYDIGDLPQPLLELPAPAQALVQLALSSIERSTRHMQDNKPSGAARGSRASEAAAPSENRRQATTTGQQAHAGSRRAQQPITAETASVTPSAGTRAARHTGEQPNYAPRRARPY
ncbi:dihydrodipicolinate synthase family protein [Timonella sp. A28]|uniref:dihydrodipicolinate synthase family protein n=1 Tax=Timonella sp. A28 TaxID=3442640 RepID=UPI003EBDBDE6